MLAWGKVRRLRASHSTAVAAAATLRLSVLLFSIAIMSLIINDYHDGSAIPFRVIPTRTERSSIRNLLPESCFL